MPALAGRMGLLCLLAALLGGCDATGTGPDPAAFDPRTERELEDAVAAAFEELEVPGALVGLWVPGHGSWTASLGVGDLATGAPFRFDDHVRIGSITKTFTVTVLLQLAEEGRLSLDDPLSKYFGTDGEDGRILLSAEIPGADRITLRQLANMTSGLANYTFDPEFQARLFSTPHEAWDPLEVVEIGIENTITGCPHTLAAGSAGCYPPGTDWNYSNTNTVLLGLVVEHVTGRPYGEVLRERILEPLGLDETSQPSDAALPEPFASGYTGQGLESGRQEATHWNPTWAFAVGDMISTFEDLRIWARALGSGTLLEAETQAERLTEVRVGPNVPGVRAYALGIGNKRGWWGHSGELPGYNSVVQYNPELDAVMVVVVNQDDAGPAVEIASTIVDLVESRGW